MESPRPNPEMMQMLLQAMASGQGGPGPTPQAPPIQVGPAQNAGPYPPNEPSGGIMELIQQFLSMDAARRTGQAGDPAKAGVKDRQNEGQLIAGLMPGVAEPLALPILAALAGGYEGAKGLGLMKHAPGPFKQTENTSPASMDNVLAVLSGFLDNSWMGPAKPKKKKDPDRVTMTRG